MRGSQSSSFIFILLKYDSSAKDRWSDAENLDLKDKRCCVNKCYQMDTKIRRVKYSWLCALTLLERLSLEVQILFKSFLGRKQKSKSCPTIFASSSFLSLKIQTGENSNRLIHFCYEISFKSETNRNHNMYAMTFENQT